MSSDSIRGYTYDTENLCPDCCQMAVMSVSIYPTVEENLDLAAKTLGIDRHDEKSFDSSTFPKVIFDSQVEDSDERCAHCGERFIQ